MPREAILPAYPSPGVVKTICVLVAFPCISGEGSPAWAESVIQDSHRGSIPEKPTVEASCALTGSCRQPEYGNWLRNPGLPSSLCFYTLKSLIHSGGNDIFRGGATPTLNTL